MRLIVTVLGLATAVSAAALPAAADDIEFHGGNSCRYSAAPTPQLDDLQHQGTLLTGGPMYAFTVVGAEVGPATDVVVTCSLQLNSNDPSTTDTTAASSMPGIGVTYLPPTPVTFTRAPNDRVYICTTLTWTNPDGSFGVEDGFDADPGTSGIQCAEFGGAAVAVHPPVGRQVAKIPGVESGS